MSKIAPLDKVGRQRRVEESEPRSEDPRVRLGEENGCLEAQPGWVVAVRTSPAGNQAFATEPS